MYQPRDTPWREEEWDASQEMHVNYFGSGWTKLYIVKMCEFFSRLGVTKHTVIRHTNVFGPHDKFDLEKSHVFGATVTKTMTSRTGSITVWGTGEEARELLYVDDLVRFVELAVDGQKSPYCTPVPVMRCRSKTWWPGSFAHPVATFASITTSRVRPSRRPSPWITA